MNEPRPAAPIDAYSRLLLLPAHERLAEARAFAAGSRAGRRSGPDPGARRGRITRGLVTAAREILRWPPQPRRPTTGLGLDIH